MGATLKHCCRCKSICWDDGAEDAMCIRGNHMEWHPSGFDGDEGIGWRSQCDEFEEEENLPRGEPHKEN